MSPTLDPEDSEDTEFDRVLSQVARLPRVSGLLEGTVVGEYRIVARLGKGTFGTVYHGVHTVIGKHAALKVLNSEFSEDQRTAERFIDEARAVNRITHPNIVDIFGFGELEDGRKYCVMELLQGETLAQALETNSCPPWADVLRILSQIAEALDAAHKNGVVHRDLKPDNVFLVQRASAGQTAAASVKLLDFGIARVADGALHDTASGLVLGTPAYMSPEQCRGERVDHRTDVYALGVLAFEMLTGRLPFAAENALQFVWQHLSDPPPLASQLAPQLPSDVDAAFSSLLAKAREERPPSASAAVAVLARALGQPGVGAVSAITAQVTPARRMPWRWLAAALVAGVAVLGFRAVATGGARPVPGASSTASSSGLQPAPATGAPLASSTAPAPSAAPAGSARASGEAQTPPAASSSARKGDAAKRPSMSKPHPTKDLEY